MEISTEMQQLRIDVDSLTNQVSSIDDNVKDIKAELIGNEYTDGSGLIHDMKVLKMEVASLKNWKNKAIWWVGGLAMGAGASVPGLIKILYAFLTIHK